MLRYKCLKLMVVFLPLGIFISYLYNLETHDAIFCVKCIAFLFQM
jgi:hypothetical protein